MSKAVVDEKVSISLGFDQRMVEYVAEHMREGDVREIELATGLDPLVVLSESLRVSWWKRMAYVERNQVVHPIAFFGISTHPDEGWIGVPWMLGTPEMEQYPLAIVRHSKDFMKLHRRRYGRMENHVHAENKPAVKLLKHLGFELEEAAPWGVRGASFNRFYSTGHGPQSMGLNFNGQSPNKRNGGD
jgi:hypothetical protein